MAMISVPWTPALVDDTGDDDWAGLIAETTVQCKGRGRWFDRWPTTARHCSDACRPAALLRARARQRAFRIRVYGHP